jgi:hypothetical protein
MIQLLTTEDVAEALGCAVRKVKYLPIPIVRVGRHRRYDPKDVAAFNARQKTLSALTPLGRKIAEEAPWHKMERNRVYFVATPHHVKIGVAVRVDGRIESLQCGCPYQMSHLGDIAGSYAFEKWLHKLFRRYHERGEWFRLTNEVHVAIVEGCRHAK